MAKLPQSEYLARGRLGKIGLEFRLPTEIMEFMLPLPNYAFYTTTLDNCQIVVEGALHTWDSLL